MALHQLQKITVGVPNLAETIGYYDEFGLTHLGDGRFSTVEGGEQLNLKQAPYRRLEEILINVDDRDDLARVQRSLSDLGFTSTMQGERLIAIEPVTAVRAVLQVAPRLEQARVEATVYNFPGNRPRQGERAPGVLREGRVRPLKLGHTVIGTTSFEQTYAFFVDAIGFKLSDRAGDFGAFIRCSTDHHNILIMNAPVVFMHHSSWQVEDIDEIGRGAQMMLQDHPDRHVWGLGRHHAGANFFYYLKDPAGNFSEYYSDMDCIVDDTLWKPETFWGAKGLFNWGPPPSPSFLNPEDLGALMTGAHSNA